MRLLPLITKTILHNTSVSEAVIVVRRLVTALVLLVVGGKTGHLMAFVATVHVSVGVTLDTGDSVVATTYAPHWHCETEKQSVGMTESKCIVYESLRMFLARARALALMRSEQSRRSRYLPLPPCRISSVKLNQSLVRLHLCT